MHTSSRKFFVALLAAASWLAGEARANLLYNASFEIESAFAAGAAINWRMNDPDDHGDTWGSASRESWRAHEGTFTLAIRGTWANAGDHGGAWQEVEARADTSYTLTAWFWADRTWSAQTQEMKIEFWNWDRSQMLGAATNSFNGIGEAWSQQDVSAVAPEGTEWARVVFHVAGVSAEGALQIDDVSLVAAP